MAEPRRTLEQLIQSTGFSTPVEGNSLLHTANHEHGSLYDIDNAVIVNGKCLTREEVLNTPLDVRGDEQFENREKELEEVLINYYNFIDDFEDKMEKYRQAINGKIELLLEARSAKCKDCEISYHRNFTVYCGGGVFLCKYCLFNNVRDKKITLKRKRDE